MPNGIYNPQCSNCDFFQGSLFPEMETERRWCKKHNFVMPYGGSEFVCSDWLHEGKASEHFRNLESGFLYDYSYQSINPPDKFRTFHELQNLIVSASIHNDSELGWVVHLNEEWLLLFPQPNISVELWFGGASNEFQILDIERKFHSGSERLPSGEWKQNYATRNQRVLHCPSSSFQVYTWVNTLIKVDEYISKVSSHEHAEALLAFGFFVYLEVIERHKKYKLVADLFHYKEFLRE